MKLFASLMNAILKLNLKFKFWLLLSLLFIIGGIVWRIQPSKTAVAPHFHAGFQVYVNNHLVDFSGDQYMHLEACTTDAQTLINDPQAGVHLHDHIGDVAHIHRPGVVWGDLFHNLNFSIPASASAYLNGQPDPNFLTGLIQPYDSLVVIIGPQDFLSQKLAAAVTREKILEVEKNKESCGQS